MSRAPADFYRYGDQILRNKALALGCLRKLSLVPRRELDQFIASPLPLVRGCVLLSGASGIGKTCFAEAHGQHPFVIHTLDQCKDIPLECDLLVFEDMRFDEPKLDFFLGTSRLFGRESWGLVLAAAMGLPMKSLEPLGIRGDYGFPSPLSPPVSRLSTRERKKEGKKLRSLEQMAKEALVAEAGSERPTRPPRELRLIGGRRKAEQPPAPEPGFLVQTRRNLETLNMDECKTALYKATTDDPLPPKEKHVLTIVRLAGEEETAAQVDAELTKRLQACRSSASATVAAKALLVLHRVASAGHVASLSQAVRELAAVCCEPQGRHAQGEYVSECAAFMRELCLWGGVGTLRDADGHAGRAWASRTVRELAAELPRLQGLTAVALECASLGRSANGALQALRVE
eukprot:jgi/Chrpa1/1444/Chrysochromulina_OHIO_Genome00008834-RA